VRRGCRYESRGPRVDTAFGKTNCRIPGFGHKSSCPARNAISTTAAVSGSPRAGRYSVLAIRGLRTHWVSISAFGGTSDIPQICAISENVPFSDMELDPDA
jgi:hypothetical protein